jgi:hypothetical protein
MATLPGKDHIAVAGSALVVMAFERIRDPLNMLINDCDR